MVYPFLPGNAGRARAARPRESVCWQKEERPRTFNLERNAVNSTFAACERSPKPSRIEPTNGRFSCFGLAVLLAGAVAFVGCATSTVESRKQERSAIYTALPPEQRELVDQGKIKVGMTPGAVYIAWGEPAEIIESETPEGHTTTWIYHGQWMEETRFWTFREVAHDGGMFLERHLESDYFPRRYIRAEIVFRDGTVQAWRTLPKPVP